MFRWTQDHANAEGLSRLPVAATESEEEPVGLQGVTVFNIGQIQELPVTASHLQKTTRCDPILSRVLHYTRDGWPNTVPDELRPFWTQRTELMARDCLIWGNRVIILSKLLPHVMEELHQYHAGIVKTKAMARSYLWWPNLDHEIEEVTKACLSWQATRNAPAVAPLHLWVWPSKPWHRINIGFAGPCYGRMFLIVVDAHSRWPEVIEMKNAILLLPLFSRLFAVYGLPLQLVSDNSHQVSLRVSSRVME